MAASSPERQEAYVAGVSTRRVEDLMEALAVNLRPVGPGAPVAGAEVVDDGRVPRAVGVRPAVVGQDTLDPNAVAMRRCCRMRRNRTPSVISWTRFVVARRVDLRSSEWLYRVATWNRPKAIGPRDMARR